MVRFVAKSTLLNNFASTRDDDSNVDLNSFSLPGLASRLNSLQGDVLFSVVVNVRFEFSNISIDISIRRIARPERVLESRKGQQDRHCCTRYVLLRSIDIPTNTSINGDGQLSTTDGGCTRDFKEIRISDNVTPWAKPEYTSFGYNIVRISSDIYNDNNLPMDKMAKGVVDFRNVLRMFLN